MTQTTFLIALGFILIAAVIAVALLSRRGAPGGEAASVALMQKQLEAMRSQMNENSASASQNINQQLAAMNQQMGSQLSEVNRQVTQQLADTTQQFGQGVLGMAKNLNEQLASVTSQVNTRLKENLDVVQKGNESVSGRLDAAAQLMSNVGTRLGRMEEAAQRIYDVGKDISSLQEILRAPKLRGVLGEFMLGDLLGQILSPDHFEMQYGFRSGEKVDAVVKLGKHLVPIDSKFPLENFQRFIQTTDDAERVAARKMFLSDVRKHVDSIAGKYILPAEGTFDFALMYIPAENVYYETIIRDESFGDDKSLCNHALARRVIPVSPNSLYAYLQAIALGLRGMRVEESALEILRTLKGMQDEIGKFHEDFSKVGTHLKNAVGAFAAADKHLEKVEGKMRLIGEKEAAELPIVEET